MSRYIDADDFFRTFEELNQEPYINFPTADVVEVVRCKECKNWQIEWLTSCKEDNYHYCADIDGTCEANFFCAFAERRTE